MQIVFQPKMKRLLDHFSVLFDSRIIYLTAEGRILYSGSNQPNCAFCKVVQQQLGLLETCRDWDKQMQQKAAREKTTLTYCCHAGLYEIIRPVFVRNSLVGYIMMGQFRSASEPSDTVKRLARQKAASDALTAAYESVPAFPLAKIAHIQQLLDAIADYIIQCEFVTKTGRGEFDALLSHIQANPEAWLSLDAAAQMLCKSPSYVAHQFRERYGCGVRHYQIQLKLQLAEESLRQSPTLPVKTIAQRLGFEDALYFSRLFKKYKGYSPTLLRHGQKPEPLTGGEANG
ncbi:MAG: PocR ligand-binding domain-containing protein [Verrucomicrobiota bacterium]|nr:PocR ligand-binding domain-containing protein [Verrucomicrobiota bacterium]